MQRVFICELIQFVEIPVYSRADDSKDFFSLFFTPLPHRILFL